MPKMNKGISLSNLRPGLSLARTYATAARPFVPPSSLPPPSSRALYKRPSKAKPASPTFYTARSTYYDQINLLETALNETQAVLRAHRLLPLPAFAREQLRDFPTVWKSKTEIAAALSNGSTMTTTRYRRVLDLLNALNECRRIARTAGVNQLAELIERVMEVYERSDKEAVLASGKAKAVPFDEHGRSYTVGRRKTSTARVWMVPVWSQLRDPEGQQGSVEELSAKSENKWVQEKQEPPKEQGEQALLNALSSLGLSDGTPTEAQPQSYPSPQPPVTATAPSPPPVVSTDPSHTPAPAQILVNALPLPTYFPHPSTRLTITLPFQLTGTLTAFNVFALVRGGGLSAQSGAVQLGISKALVAQLKKLEEEGRIVVQQEEEDGSEGRGWRWAEAVLRQAGLLRRDPRMVERKKTGLAKARKRYTWVKR